MKEVGYDNLTVRKICEVAEILTGKFYSFFKSKEDLLCFYYTKGVFLIGVPMKVDMIYQNL